MTTALLALCLASLAAAPIAVKSSLSATFLRCEYRVDPLGIDETQPRLSWIDESGRRGERQTAYQILVASSPENLSKDDGDLWDSGKVDSDETNGIVYAGRPLRSRMQAWWKVRVWDQDGQPSGYSKPAFWTMGLLDKSDWKGVWINTPVDIDEPDDLSDGHWIWYPEGEPDRGAPEGSRYFRAAFDVEAGKKVKRAILRMAADDHFVAYLNGKEIAKGDGFRGFFTTEITPSVASGKNVLAVKATNDKGAAGLVGLLKVTYEDGSETRVITGRGWKAAREAAPNWADPHLDDSAQPESYLIPGGIKAGPWGEPKQSTVAGPAPHMRRGFTVSKPVKRATIYASALGLYKLELDGKLVARDVFTPGWTDYNKRVQYQTYDVTDRLKEGSHALGMILGDGWYAGHVGWSGRNQYGPVARGLAQLEIEYADGSSDTIATDQRWKVGEGPIRESDLLMGETYDATKSLNGWATAGFDDSKWLPPHVKDLGDVPLVAACSQPVRELEELKPKKIMEPKPGVFVYDLGQNMVGWARLKARGKAGDTVQLRFAEMLNPDGTIYTTNLRGAKATDRYTLAGSGDETFEPSFTFHGFRYVEVTGYPGKPGIGAITGVVAGSDTPKTGSFECSNAMVNQLQHNIFWGQRGNYLEVPTDCPQRDERLGWMGDAQIFIRTACFNNDVSAFMTKWVRDIEDAQGPEGGYTDVTPRIVDLTDGAPAWGDAGVIVPWTVYLCYGDKRMLEQHFASAKKWIDYIDEENPDHLWVKRSHNNFGDWLNIGADMPREVLATAYYAHSTRLVAKMARVIGRSDEAAKYDRLADEIREAFNQHFVDADGRIKGNTQTCYVLALWFDLLSPANREKAARYLVEDIQKRDWHLSTGFVGVGYLTPTLTSIGKLDVAYKLLENDTFPSWGYSIKHGATTIWERWDGWTEEKGFQDPGMNSFNHYSLGSVGEWMYHTVAGIDLDPEQPGYKHIIIRPRPGGGLTWAKASLDSIRGKISSSWKQEGGAFSLDVTVPANTTATVYLPAGSADRVTEGGKPASKADGVRFVRTENGSTVFEVGGGTYHFAVK